MAVALDYVGPGLSRRGSRRSILRLLALLTVLAGATTHDSEAVDAKKRKDAEKRTRGNRAKDAADHKSRTKGKTSDQPQNRRKHRNKRRNAKKHKNDDTRNTPATGVVEEVDPVRPVEPVASVQTVGPVGAVDPVDPVEPVEPVEPLAAPVALGAYVFNGPGDPQELDRFANEIGRSPAIIMWYEQWGGWDQGRLRLREVEAVLSRGATPMITWDPWDPYAGLDQPAYRLVNIALGHFDAYIDSWATALASVGQPVYLRFGHEMNGDWYCWCAGVNGNSAADYVAAWRHMHDRFVAAGATNVRWVWSPNIEYAGSTAFADLYPGDAYVDWVGLDGYNWGTSKAGKAWLSFEGIFLGSYQRLLSLTAKPMMIAEMASTEVGGDKAAWIRQAFLDQLPTTFPKVRAVTWFHENKETDWRVTSSAAALAAFQEAAGSPYLQGRLE